MNKFSKLRKQAEKILLSTPRDDAQNQQPDPLKVLHELDTYQVELELQNKELQASNHKLVTEIEAHYRHYEIAPVGYLTLNDKGKILELNSTLATMLGVNKNSLLDSPFTNLIINTDQDIFYFYLQSLLEKKKPQSCQLRLYLKHDGPLWVKLDSMPDPKKSRFFLAISDISVLKQQEQDLHMAASVFHECTEGMMVTDAGVNIIKVNKAFTTITGYSAEEVLGKNPNILKSGKHNDIFYQSMWMVLNKQGQWQGEIWNRRKDGEIYPEWLTINKIENTNNQISYFIGVFTDITHRKESEAHIHFMAYFDPLTELPNRVLLEDRFNQAIAQSHRNQNHGALFMLDLDNFKIINDSLGHLIGDELLKHIARRLKSCIREQDTVSRLGGDEFVVLLPDLDQDTVSAKNHATTVANKIINELSKAINIEHYNLHITASIGIVIYPFHDDNFGSLIKLADNAMYQAKKNRSE